MRRRLTALALAVLMISGGGIAAAPARAAPAWRPRPPLTIARIGAALATVDGLIVDTGGFNSGPGLLRSVEVRRTSPGSAWRIVAPMRAERANSAAVALDGRVWVLGGYDPDDTPLATVELYDPRANRWSAGPALPRGRAQAGAAVLHGVPYLVGGFVPAPNGERLTGSAIAFDPRRHRWTPIAPLPVARAFIRLAAAGDHLYAIGGRTADGASVPRVDRYDPRTNTWTTVAAMAQDRGVPGVTVVGRGRHSRIVVVGGCQFVNGQTVQLRRTTEVYDLTTGRWRLVPALLPTGRCSLAAATESDGTVLAIGGVSGTAPTVTPTASVDALHL